MNIYLKIVFSSLLLWIALSCQKADESDIRADNFRYYNEVLNYELSKRNQISNLAINGNLYSIMFSDGLSIHLSGGIFPILTTKDDDCWLISGEETNIPIQYDVDGHIVLPSLTIGQSNYWAINEVSTEMPANLYISCLNKTEHDNGIIEGVVIINNNLSFLLSDKTHCTLSITDDNYYLVPSYYKQHLIEKEKLAEKSITESNNNFTSFIFISDPHWNYNYHHSPALIRHITDYSGINKVFMGGDVIYKHESVAIDALQEGLDFQKAFSFLGPHFYCVYGNHDDNSDGQQNKVESHLSEKQVNSYLQSHMNKLEKKEGYNFYFDEFQSKTRYIGLDTGRFYYSKNRTTATNTARFLIDALQSVPEGWHIIVVSHIFLCTVKKDGIQECCFNNFFYFPLTIMDNYNLRQTGKYTYNKESVFYDFTNSNGIIEFCIGGHVHIEGLLYTDSGIPVIAVPTDSRNVINNEVAKKGSISEQSVSIAIVDYSAQKLNLFFVGRGTDREIALR